MRWPGPESEPETLLRRGACRLSAGRLRVGQTIPSAVIAVKSAFSAARRAVARIRHPSSGLNLALWRDEACGGRPLGTSPSMPVMVARRGAGVDQSPMGLAGGDPAPAAAFIQRFPVSAPPEFSGPRP